MRGAVGEEPGLEGVAVAAPYEPLTGAEAPAGASMAEALAAGPAPPETEDGELMEYGELMEELMEVEALPVADAGEEPELALEPEATATPWEGETAAPDEAAWLPVTTVEKEVAALDAAADVTEAWAAPVAALEAAEVAVEEWALLELEDTALQERSNRGVVLRVLPTMPKLGFGVTGAASWRVYHQVLIFPKLGQPTASQYFLAFSTDGTPRFWVLPLTGHPVSVIQTGLPAVASLVC